jgi:hypothetical protein
MLTGPEKLDICLSNKNLASYHLKGLQSSFSKHTVVVLDEKFIISLSTVENHQLQP